MALLVFANSCKLREKPEFVRIDKVAVVQADFKTMSLKADAVFLNHNHLGGSLQTDNIDVYIDDHLVAKVSSEEFEVPAKDEFMIPLSVSFDTSKLVESGNKDLLGSLINQFLNKKIVVRIKGDLAYKVVGFGSTYPIDHIEELIIE